ncbi:auxin-induced protein X15 [Punica granatum]|uniref:Uncharacterized protein n=2 Tax=Punica granatum TaxID=22663 RepID=A0A218XCL8_PUNGR|nr:auxin-induced protein X15 [Punica granatum]OWM82538.1 hypothetical protein CDL15_Pgr002113 [Punica granatum]PKI38508.1 hypothetical protein CRG98_041073 [Punica granatum]
MLGKKISIKKLAKKVKVRVSDSDDHHHHELLLGDQVDHDDHQEESTNSPMAPTGFFAVYVGEERKRFQVPTGFLSHPLFKMLLEKAYDEFGFEQRNGLVVPCSVATFQEVLNAVECCNGRFDFGNLVEEFI